MRYSKEVLAVPVLKRLVCFRGREIDAAAGWALSYAAMRRVLGRTTAALVLDALCRGGYVAELRWREGVGGAAVGCPAAGSGDDAGEQSARR